MTREEAIKILKREVGCRRLPTCPDGVNLDASCKNCEYATNYGDLTEAMEIAIKALEEPKCITIAKEKILQCISELEENSKYHADFIQRNTKFIIEGLRMALDFMKEGEEHD